MQLYFFISGAIIGAEKKVNRRGSPGFCGVENMALQENNTTDTQHELPRARVFEALTLVFKNFFNFTGRARRSEYWSIVFFIPVVAGLAFIPYIGQVFPLLFFILTLSVTIRRLHDIGKSGWWVLMFTLVPLLSLLVFFISIGISASIIPTEGMGASEEQNEFMGDLFFVISLFTISVIAMVVTIGVIWFSNKGDTGQNIYGPDPRQPIIYH